MEVLDRINGSLRGEAVGVDDIPAVNEFEVRAEQQQRR